MNRSEVVLDGVAVHDEMHHYGFYVLGRRDGGRWLVLGSRVAYQHIETTWANSAGKWDERLLVEVRPWGAPEILRRSSS